MYSAYLCGSAHDPLNGIAIDAAGNAFLAGSTPSLDFPVVNALQPSPAGSYTTSFVSKLDSTGAHLLYSYSTCTRRQ